MLKKSALQIVLSRVPEVAAEKQSLLSRLVQVKSRELTSSAGEFIESWKHREKIALLVSLHLSARDSQAGKSEWHLK